MTARAKISTEALLTRPDGFGIATATPAQRAAARIMDGLPLGELAAHPDVAALVGGVDVLETLDAMGALTPTEVVFLAAVRSAKTILACCAALRATQCVDVSKLGHGEVPRVSLVSLKLDTSAVAFRLLHDTIANSKVLKRLLLDATADSLTLKHPSGRPIEIACVAGAKAGGGLVARWSAGVIFDEAPRMSAASDAVVNLADARSAILGRLLPGAQALYIGSPWSPNGEVYNMVQEHWRKPSAHMVVLRGTGPMLNPTWWTPERCLKLQEQDSAAYTTDVLGEFADPESGLLNPMSVRTNTRESPLELPPERNRVYAAAVDPSEGTAGGNGFTVCIVQVVGDTNEDASRELSFQELWQQRHWSRLGINVRPKEQPLPTPPEDKPMRKFRVALAREFRGQRPEQIWEQVAALLKTYGITEAWTDQYAASANCDLAARYGLTVRVDKATASSKLEDFQNLATMIHTDLIELPPDRQFRADLLSVKKRVTQTGMTIVLPRTGDGRHADYAPALCSAVKHADAIAGRDTGPSIFIPSERNWGGGYGSRR